MSKLIQQPRTITTFTAGNVNTSPTPPGIFDVPQDGEWREFPFNEISGSRELLEEYLNFDAVGVYEDLLSPHLAGNHDVVTGLLPKEAVPSCLNWNGTPYTGRNHLKLAQRFYGQTRGKVEVSSSTQLSTKNLSVSWWFQAEGLGTEQTLLWLEGSFKLVLLSSGALHLTVWLDDGSTVTCESPGSVGTWVQNVWIIFRDVDKIARLFLGGLEVASSAPGTDSTADVADSPRVLYIGGAPDEGHFVGIVDHLMITHGGREDVGAVSNMAIQRYYDLRSKKYSFPMLEEFSTPIVDNVPYPFYGKSARGSGARWNVADGVLNMDVVRTPFSILSEQPLYTVLPIAIYDVYQECSVWLTPVHGDAYLANLNGFHVAGVSIGTDIQDGNTRSVESFIEVTGDGKCVWGRVGDSSEVVLGYDTHYVATTLGISARHYHDGGITRSIYEYWLNGTYLGWKSKSFSSPASPRLYTKGASVAPNLWSINGVSGTQLSGEHLYVHGANFDWYWIDSLKSTPIFDTYEGWGFGHRMKGPWSIGRRT